MNTYSTERAPVKASTQDHHREYVLGWLRCLHTRLGMFQNEVDHIGVALKGSFLTPDDALVELHELDPILLSLVGAGETPQ